MGNCYSAGTAAILQHPSGRTEKINRPLNASQIMAANPGYYVAIINPIPNSNIPATTNTAGASARAPAKHLKLLLPDDTLHLGHLYRLVSFQEVLGNFKTKKRQRLISRTITACRERRRIAANSMIDAAESSSPAIIPGTGRRQRRWMPSLQSIVEVAGS